MVSRMEKYYKNTKTTLKRSEKNRKIYDNIYDDASYSNIEGIATIDRNNEIDLAKLRNTIKNREEYSRRRKFKFSDEEEDIPETTKDFVEKEQKIYDIRDILNKARDKKPVSDTPRSLDNTNYNILKNLQLHNEEKIKNREFEQEEELKELINTITNMSELNKLSDNELGLDMLNLNDDKLESSKSVQELLKQARQYQEQESKPLNLDNSFYTSSLNFSKDDFEDAQDILNKKKSRHILKKIIVFIGLLLMTAVIIFGGYYLIK